MRSTLWKSKIGSLMQEQKDKKQASADRAEEARIKAIADEDERKKAEAALAQQKAAAEK